MLVAVQPEARPCAVALAPLHPRLEVAVLERLARALGSDGVQRIRLPGRADEGAARPQVQDPVPVDLLETAPGGAGRAVVPDVVVPRSSVEGVELIREHFPVALICDWRRRCDAADWWRGPAARVRWPAWRRGPAAVRVWWPAWRRRPAGVRVRRPTLRRRPAAAGRRRASVRGRRLNRRRGVRAGEARAIAGARPRCAHIRTLPDAPPAVGHPVPD